MTPTGSPGEIEAIAASLAAANQGLEGAASALKQTASGLGGIDWSGPAEERFSVAAHALCRATSTYHETLADVAAALRSYADELQSAQRVIDDARIEYETAKAAQADVGAVVGSLLTERARADEDEDRTIAGLIEDQQAAARRASHTAEEALRRAIEAREHFDRAQKRASSVLDGGMVIRPPTLGGPPLGVANSGTGGGIVGGGFGVPWGGLSNASGVVPWDDVGDLDPLAKSSWDDWHGQTEVDDLENVIDAALLATGIGGVVKLGFNLSRAAARRLLGMGAAKTEREVADAGLSAAARRPLWAVRPSDKFWNMKTEFGGHRVYQRDDLIDPNKVDDLGRTNVERMEEGYAPIGPDGRAIQLHHMTQRNDSAIAETTGKFHRDNYDAIHIFPRGSKHKSLIDRPAFDRWRERYWDMRAHDFKN